MKTQSNTLVKVYFAAILVIIPLVAAAWFTLVGFPMLLRQILLCVWGVGASPTSFTCGWTAGLASVVLAALLAFPLAYLFERGGNSLGGPAILHTSSNAPMVIMALPESFIASALLPHMGVVLISFYLIFALQRFLADPAPDKENVRVPQSGVMGRRATQIRGGSSRLGSHRSPPYF